MRAEHPAAAKTEDFEPLMPIDVVRPPTDHGIDDLHPGSPLVEPAEVIESNIEEKKRNQKDVPETSEGPEEEDQAITHKDFPDYKGDRNAPIDAEHPLANPPASEEVLPPDDPRD